MQGYVLVHDTLSLCALQVIERTQNSTYAKDQRESRRTLMRTF